MSYSEYSEDYSSTDRAIANEPVTKESLLGSPGERVRYTLTWRNLSYDVEQEAKGGLCGGNLVTKRILNKVAGSILPAQFVAIMGPSGAGKSTILNILAGRIDQGVSGTLLVNGRDLTANQRRRASALVAQDDLLFPTLTVRETLQFSARLRLPKELSTKEKLERVEHLIVELGLDKAAKTRIGKMGHSGGGISGGERKRVSIAVELLTDPGLMFVDEPTSGLDSFTAESVVRTLIRLSRTGRTIVATIHQPSSDIFRLFDRLLLMSRGEIAYAGQARDAVSYFKRLGHPCPQYTNPSDFFLGLLAEPDKVAAAKALEAAAFDTDTESDRSRSRSSGSYSGSETLSMDDSETEQQEEVKQSVAGSSAAGGPAAVVDSKGIVSANTGKDDQLSAILQSYRESDAHKTVLTEQRQLEKITSSIEMGDLSTKYTTNWFVQTALVTGRSFKVFIRDPLLLGFRVAQALILSLMAGLLYLQISNHVIDIQNRSGALFFVDINALTTTLFSTLLIFPLELPLFLREHGNSMYSTSAYFMSKNLAELPFQIIIPAVYSIVTYFMIGFQLTAAKFFIYLAGIILMSNTGNSFGYMVSAGASHPDTALTMGPVLLLPMMLLGGFFIDLTSVQAWIRWLQYLSPIRYGFAIVTINEFTGLTIQCLPKEYLPNGVCPVTNGETVLANFGFSGETLGMNFGCLIALFIGFRIIALVIMLVKHSKTT